MFRQIVASITLAALTLWTIGCSSVATVPAEEAVRKNKLKWKTESKVTPTALELKDGRIVDLDSSGVTYSIRGAVFNGRSPDGRPLDISSELVKKVSVTRLEGCATRQEETDMGTFARYMRQQHAEEPLTVGSHRVIAVTLSDGLVLELGKRGIRLDCADSTWICHTKSGEFVSTEQEDIQSYTYRYGDQVKTAAFVLGMVALAAAITLAILAIAWDPDFGVTFY